jgi:hypothetical protein
MIDDERWISDGRERNSQKKEEERKNLKQSSKVIARQHH